MSDDAISDRSRAIALLMAGILGVFGAHRFYAGKVKSGVLMAVTVGGLGIWYLYDLILVASGVFRDAEGRLIADWDIAPQAGQSLSEEVLLELDRLRAEVAELHERVDFTERLLAEGRTGQLRDSSTRNPDAGRWPPSESS